MKYKVFSMRRILVLVIFIAAAIILCQGIARPFETRWAWDDALYTTIARNYLRYGLIQTKFGMVRNVEWTALDNFAYFTHHPPLPPLSVALSLSIFGVKEWAARLMPILFSLGGLLTLYLLASKMFDEKVARWALLLGAASPAFLFYGKQVGQVPITLFFCLQTFLCFWMFRQKHQKRWLYLCLFCLLLGEFSDWHAYYVVLCLTLFAVWQQKSWRAGLKEMRLFWLMSFAMFGLHLLLTFWQTGSIIGGGLTAALRTRSLLAFAGKEINLVAYARALAGHILSVLGLGPTLMAAITICRVWKQPELRRHEPLAYLLALLLFGLIHLVLFPQASYIHDFLIIYLWPALVLLSAFFIKQELEGHRPITAAIFIVLQIIPALCFTQILNQENFRFKEIGQSIAYCTREDKDRPVVIPWDGFAFSFYAERDLIYGVTTLERLESVTSSSSDLIYLKPTSFTSEEKLVEYLNQAEKTTCGDFEVYRIKASN